MDIRIETSESDIRRNKKKKDINWKKMENSQSNSFK
jgi:hypothetical protein